MTINIAESLNSTLRHARKLPITTLVEYVCDMMQRWFYDRCNTVARTDTQLTPTTSSHVQRSLDATQYMQVKSVDNFIYHVASVYKDHVVNLQQGTCTCRRFELFLLHMLLLLYGTIIKHA